MASSPHLRIRLSSYTEILKAADLLAEYAAECSIAEIGAICPQAEMYAAMEATGLMRIFGAYQGDTLAGFVSVLIYVLPHYGKKIATVESLFLGSRHRRSGLGNELLATVEKHAQEQGCVVILYSAPAESRLEKMLSCRKSYRRTNSIFTRKLA